MRFLLCVAALLPAAPLHALEYCEDLWFTRNLLFHKAGYCFGSPLGQAVFGNDGCQSAGVTLDPAAQALVDQAKRAEAVEACRIDTARQSLEIPMIAQRIALEDVPFPTLTESACIGWTAQPVPLLTARDPGALVLAQVQSGDTLLFQFEGVGAWQFVEVMRDGATQAMGWAQLEVSNTTCETIAG